MSYLRRLATFFVLGLAAVAAFGQSSLSGVATSSGGTALVNGTVTLQLENCVGTPTSTTFYSFVLSSSGTLSGTVAPNTTIGTGCSSTTFYQVSAYDQNAVLQWRRNYSITNATWNITTAVQMTTIPQATGVAGPAGGLPGATDISNLTGSDFGAKLAACLSNVNSVYGGICEGRNLGASPQSMSSGITISTPNTVVNLPCATITTAQQIIVTPGTRNVSIHGCSYEGGSTASGTQGGTVWAYTGASVGLQVGDTTFQVNTPGFHIDNIKFDTSSAASGAIAFAFYRTQELSVENVYLTGNNALTPTSGTGPQYGIYLNGSGNYSGGNFDNVYLNGFGEGLVLDGGAQNIGDYANASTFKKLHIVCPSGGTSTQPTFGIDVRAGDGNDFTGGDVESCYTMLHLGAKAVNNTFSGVRNENSTYQIVADSGSSNNQWKGGGTLYIGELVDNGTHNSFEDAYHRAENGMKGDWYASQQDATVTNHYRLGIGAANERGLLDRYQTDYGYRWTIGLSDGTAGAQSYQILDEINGIYRLIIGQYTAPVAGEVTAVVIQHGGSYSSATPPTVSFAGGGGTGAAVTPVMQQQANGNWTVSGVTGLVPGSGYTSVPTAVFTGSNQITSPTANVEISLVGSQNNQTVINAAGTGAIVLNGSTNAGTGGVTIGSGGPTVTTVAQIDGSGNTTLEGWLNVFGVTTHYANVKVMNAQDAEIDYILQAGQTTSQKESLTYKDYNGASQWYATKDQNNNWSLNSAIDNVDHFKAYQSGDDYIDAAGTGAVRINYEPNSGTGGFNVYSGGTSPTSWFSVGGSGYTKLSSLAGTGHRCVYADSSGGLNVEGADCGTSNATGSVTSVGLTEGDSYNLFTFGTAVTSAGNVSVSFTGTLPVALGGRGTNAVPSPGQIDVGNAGGTGFGTLTVGGDATLSSTGQLIVTKSNGTAFGSAAFQPATAFDTSGAASTAQSTAESYSSNASNLSTGTVPATRLPAATPSAQGAVQLPSGASGNTLGTAAMQPTSAFDAAGAATTAVSGSMPGNAATATKLASNTLGCLDGWDHLPCTVYIEPLVSESVGNGSYTTVWTSSAAGVYLVTGYMYGTVAGTCSAGSGTAELFVKATMNGGTANGWAVASAQVANSISSGSITASPVFNVAASTAFSVETTVGCSSSGTISANPTWSRGIQITRLQ